MDISDTTFLPCRSLSNITTCHVGGTPALIDANPTRVRSYLECGSEMSYAYSLVNGVFILLLSYIIPMVLMVVNYGRIMHYVIKVSSHRF